MLRIPRPIVRMSAFCLGVVSLAVVTREYRVYRVASDSMNPTLCAGDYVVVERLAHGSKLSAGKIVVFMNERDAPVIKRVIALPEQRARTELNRAVVDENILYEPYACDSNSSGTGAASGPLLSPHQSMLVGPTEVFVLGDNRAESVDSRTFGNVALTRIAGTVTFTIPAGQPIVGCKCRT